MELRNIFPMQNYKKNIFTSLEFKYFIFLNISFNFSLSEKMLGKKNTKKLSIYKFNLFIGQIFFYVQWNFFQYFLCYNIAQILACKCPFFIFIIGMAFFGAIGKVLNWDGSFAKFLYVVNNQRKFVK